jgi:predicted dehydrogenase
MRSSAPIGQTCHCRKAFTTTVAEAKELAAIAEAKSKACCFPNRRWDSDFKTVKQVLAEGVLGEIVEAEFHFDRYNPVLSPKQHKETLNAGAGILDLGPHLIDQALYLFGFPKRFMLIFVLRESSLVDDWIDIVCILL